MSINFAQIHVSLATDGIYALPIIRGKMMEFHEIWEQSLKKNRFVRIVEALKAAQRWELARTSAMLQHQLELMGGWEDEWGDWHDDTRPIKPIDSAAGTDIAAGWEV